MSSIKQRGRPKTIIEKEQPPSKKIKVEKAFTTILKQPANIKLTTKKTTTQNVTKNQQKECQISTRSGRKIKKPSFFSSYENTTNHNGGGGGKAEDDGDDGEKPLEHDSTTTTAETGISDIENDENRYDSIAAILPTFLDLSLKVNDDGKDLDELVIDGKEMELLKDEEINKYVLACQAKSQKCNIHFALTHLAANKYCIKTALKTFDQKFCGKNFSEFWTSDELKTFVRIMNNTNNHKHKSYKNMHKISKNIPNKSTGDVVNAYYALKKNNCSFGRVFTICPEIIKNREIILGYEYVESIKCENCVKHLWTNPSLKYDINNLCSLCKLYHFLYGKFRPNAKSCISQMFDISSMTHEKCFYGMLKDDFNENVFNVNAKDKKADGKISHKTRSLKEKTSDLVNVKAEAKASKKTRGRPKIIQASVQSSNQTVDGSAKDNPECNLPVQIINLDDFQEEEEKRNVSRMGSGLNSRSFKKIVESNNSDEEVYCLSSSDSLSVLNETHGKSESSNSEEKDDNLLRGETYSRSLKKIVKSNDPEESIVLNDKVGKHKSRREELREEASGEEYQASRKKAKKNRSFESEDEKDVVRSTRSGTSKHKHIKVGKHKSRHEELREEAFVEKYQASRKKAKRNRSCKSEDEKDVVRSTRPGPSKHIDVKVGKHKSRHEELREEASDEEYQSARKKPKRNRSFESEDEKDVVRSTRSGPSKHKHIKVGKHKSRHEELREEAFVEKYRASRKKAKRNRSEKLPNGIHIGGMRYAKIVNNGTAVCIRDFYITSYGTYEPFNEGLVFDTRGIRYLKHSLPDLKKLFKP